MDAEASLEQRHRDPAEVCLVHTPCLDLRDDRLEPPLGLLYVATTVQAAGFAVRLVDLAAEGRPDLDALVPTGARMYGFSTYSVNYLATLELARAIRRREPGALLVAGGPHATALPSEVLADGFDVVVTGEGELACLELARRLRAGERPAGLIRGEGAPDLDALPWPDYGLVNLSTYSRVLGGERCVSVLSSRGCPYPCSFCNSNIMGAGRAMRYRSPADVVAEIQALRARHGVRNFRFQDDIFTIHRARVLEMAAALAPLGIHYRCFARVNTLTPELADALARSGCVHVSFGVESGSPSILAHHAMSKRQTPEQIRRALHTAKDAGIRSRIFLIVGFPGETDATVQETLDLVLACPWDEFSVYPLIAYPGTPLHDHPERYGITHVDKNYRDYLQIGRNYRAGFTIRTDGFDERQVRVWRDRVIAELRADGRIWAGDAQGFQ